MMYLVSENKVRPLVRKLWFFAKIKATTSSRNGTQIKPYQL